jgi:hypothetical protein
MADLKVDYQRLDSIERSLSSLILSAVVSEISVRPALDEVLPRFSSETEALVDGLPPSWRSSAA